MKKLLALILILVLSLSVCMLLTSCMPGNDGMDGADGQTPYIGENGNWWIGETDTGVKAAGSDGKDGKDGVDGQTPYIGENGNWWIGDIDTGVKANGAVSNPDLPPADPSEDMTEITVKKTSSHDTIRTVDPGDEITYTFTVTNTGDEAKEFSITDVIPALTTYVGGDASVSGSALTLNIVSPAGETVTASYTVKVTEDRASLGAAISSDSAEFAGNMIPCADIHIGRTFNEYDMQKLVVALYAMRESEMKGKDLLKFHFVIAFGMNNPIAEDAADVAHALFLDFEAENSLKYSEMIIPGLYGGKAIADSHRSRFCGSPAEAVKVGDIYPGDVLLVLSDASDSAQAKMFVTDGTRLFDITGRTAEASASAVLDGISANDYFAVLRPSLESTNEVFYRSQPFYAGETNIERAIIAAANAFILRGDRAQYGDSSLASGVSRWERNKTPEDYTFREIGYTNCTGFTHDVFYTALGWDYGSFNLYAAPASMMVYKYSLTGNETDEEKAAIEEIYRSTLKVGDIIYYRYSGNNHGMLYLGNGNLMHCTGSVYNTSTSNYYEVQEASIRYQLLDTLFTPGNSRYFFQTENPRTNIYIIRPLNDWNGELPEQALNRIENMQGVVAEKVSSHTLGQTVNPGDLITYTFKIFNTNGYKVTLKVTDIVPEGTDLLIDGIISNNRSLSWDIEIAAGEEVQICYTVKVSEDAESGSAIVCSGESLVGGVPVRMTPLFVGRTLTEDEQAEIVEVAHASVGGGVFGVSLVNKIYKDVFGVEAILGTSISALEEGLFLENGSLKKIAESGHFADLIAPTLYGGKNVGNSTRFLGERTRMLWERNLIVGDILFLRGSSSSSAYVYMYIGDGMVFDLQKLSDRQCFERLEDALGWKEFAILRPSLAFGE